MADKIFAGGMVFKLPRAGAPSFVVGSLGIKVEDFKKFLDEHVKQNGWVDLDLLLGQNGHPYAALNTYQPEKPKFMKEEETVHVDGVDYPIEPNPDDVPF